MTGRILMCIVIGCALLSSSADASMSLVDYTAARKEGGQRWITTRMYLFGVADGFSWANVVLNQDHRKRLYCPPGDLEINVDNVIDIVDRMIEKYPKRVAGADVDMLVAFGLQETFPCQK